jgi:hypothetical protein
MEPYVVTVDLARQRLDIVQRGFWNDTIFDRFAAEFESALHQLHKRGGCLVALVDGTDFAVQPRALLARFDALLRDLAPLCARRTAVLVAAELNRMQVQHAGQAIAYRLFETRALAEAWLAEPVGVQD